MIDHDPTLGARERLITAGVILVCIVFVGAFGFYAFGHFKPTGHPWPLFDCFYMTVISITTVGYGEILPGMEAIPLVRVWTMLVILSGLGIAAYAVSALTTYFVEGEFGRLRSRRKMEKQLERLRDHIIVCGVGTTGIHVVEELSATGWPAVAIDTNPAHLKRASDRLPNLITILGDATDEVVLERAGIRRAKGVVAALTNDPENLYIVVSARELNPALRIVAKGIDVKASDKLRKAGADKVVNPALIGGVRLVSEMIRPQVVEFMDVMMRDTDHAMRIEEVIVPAGSWLADQTLADLALRQQHGLLVLALRDTNGGAFHYAPDPTTKVAAGCALILLGETSAASKLRASLTTS